MPLTDTFLRSIKPEAKTRRYSDEKSMYIEVSPEGGKWFRLKYRFRGKEKRMSLGTYPEVSLREARDRRDEARRLVAQGIDPSAARRVEKREAVASGKDTFRKVAKEWFDKFSKDMAAGHSERVWSRMENDVLPYVGDRAISDLDAADMLEVVERIAARTLDTAHRALTNCSQIFRYAITTRRCKSDPCRDLRGAIPRPRTGHFAATTDPRRLGQIIRLFDAYPGSKIVRAACRLAPLVFVRPGELRKAEWSQIDLEEGLWEYTPSKAKTGELPQPHIVPLSKQAIAILREVHEITGAGKLVFPGHRKRTQPMSDNAVLSAMRSMEIGKDEMTGHGFRAVARTILDEVLDVRTDIIEHQLAHAVKDPNGRAYNRTKHLTQRREMMQRWADHLDQLKHPKPPAGSAG